MFIFIQLIDHTGIYFRQCSIYRRTIITIYVDPLDISGIMSAYGERDAVRILFSEVPGALIQISDIDYDYVDAELLLQDIAYYPIGHPRTGSGGITLRSGGESGISGILQSLLNSQTSEGED